MPVALNPPFLFLILGLALLYSTIGRSDEESKEEGAPNPVKWDIIEYDGKSYVSATNISNFYQFPIFSPNPKTQSATFVFPSLKLKLNSDGKHREIQVNKARISLIGKTVWDEKNQRLLLSTLDLAYVLDPVIRPSHIRVEDAETERERPHFFSMEGDEALIKRLDYDLLKNELVTRGLKIAKNRSDGNAIHSRLVFEKKNDLTKPDQVSTHWFWKPKTSESNTLSIALATSLHSHLAHTTELEDNALSPRKIDGETPIPARAEVIFTIGDSFDSFESIRRAIADAIMKSIIAIGSDEN